MFIVYEQLFFFSLFSFGSIFKNKIVEEKSEEKLNYDCQTSA